MITITVRYQETDRMQIAHHASYFGWLEVARTEFMKKGLPYRELEAEGVLLPVVEVGCRYIRSVDYDDKVDIAVSVSMSRASVRFDYELTCDGNRVASGFTNHVWADARAKQRTLVTTEGICGIGFQRVSSYFYFSAYELLWG